MPKLFKETYLASLGIIVLSHEKAIKMAKSLIKKGELAKEKQQKFVTDLLEESRKNTSEIAKIINERIEYLAKKGEPLKEKQDKLIKDLTYTAKKTGAITEQKLKEIVKNSLEKSRDIKEKQQKIIKDVKGKITKSDKEKIEETLAKLNIPTKEDLDEIKDKLDKLMEELKKKGEKDEYIQ